jgi:hypothetical protein
LEERDIIEAEPEACLTLMNAIVPERPPFWFGSMRGFLDALIAVRPELSGDPKYRRLDRIATERGL